MHLLRGAKRLGFIVKYRYMYVKNIKKSGKYSYFRYYSLDN